MKKLLLSALLLTATTGFALAGKSVDPGKLPAPVTTALEEYFPKAKILKAEEETDDNEKEYEILLHYINIKLEVDITPEGVIKDVDMKK